ncbi:MAG TPA: hypothetical protein VHW04_20810, partial [Solirubrobacteraceae bacterium]|nr:hypothetical protein [Solirubrobacteraceae bacterium]
ATQMHASALASLAGLGRAQRYAAAAAIARSGAQPVHVLLAGVSPARGHEVSGAAYVSGLHLVYLIAALALVVGAGLAVGYLRGAHSCRPAAAPPAPAAESLPAGVVPAADGVTAAAGTSVSPD